MDQALVVSPEKITVKDNRILELYKQVQTDTDRAKKDAGIDMYEKIYLLF